jgi:hypothetical protein
MENINLLLTEEFIVFSQKIAHLYNEKKKKKHELKTFYDKIQAELSVLDDEAKAMALEFDDWKRTQTGERHNDSAF